MANSYECALTVLVAVAVNQFNSPSARGPDVVLGVALRLPTEARSNECCRPFSFL